MSKVYLSFVSKVLPVEGKEITETTPLKIRKKCSLE